MDDHTPNLLTNIEVKILQKILAKNRLKNSPAEFILGVQRRFNIRKLIMKFTILKDLIFFKEMPNTRAAAENMQSEIEQKVIKD